jgi:hypothetical protein
MERVSSKAPWDLAYLGFWRCSLGFRQKKQTRSMTMATGWKIMTKKITYLPSETWRTCKNEGITKNHTNYTKGDNLALFNWLFGPLKKLLSGIGGSLCSCVSCHHFFHPELACRRGKEEILFCSLAWKEKANASPPPTRLRSARRKGNI